MQIWVRVCICNWVCVGGLGLGLSFRMHIFACVDIVGVSLYSLCVSECACVCACVCVCVCACDFTYRSHQWGLRCDVLMLCNCWPTELLSVVFLSCRHGLKSANLFCIMVNTNLGATNRRQTDALDKVLAGGWWLVAGDCWLVAGGWLIFTCGLC